jgi:hypothetical protein
MRQKFPCIKRTGDGRSLAKKEHEREDP